MRLPLDIKFKGNRNYIHSTDIFHAIEIATKAHFGAKAWVCLLGIRNLIYNNCFLILPEKSEELRIPHVAFVTVKTGENKRNGFIITSDEPVLKRYQFDEKIIYHSTTIVEQSALQQYKTSFSPIEEAVSLTKLLHNTLYPQQTGRWIFSELQLNSPFSDRDLFTITILQNLAGRMTTSTIIQNNKRIGRISFVLLKND